MTEVHLSAAEAVPTADVLNGMLADGLEDSASVGYATELLLAYHFPPNTHPVDEATAVELRSDLVDGACASSEDPIPTGNVVQSIAFSHGRDWVKNNKFPIPANDGHIERMNARREAWEAEDAEAPS